jgi:succinate dehydrogenase / fumarate reductase flavoprotein subunit
VGAQEGRGRDKASKDPASIPDEDRDYYLERKYPSFGNLSPRDIASRAAKEACDDGRGVGPGGRGVYLDFRDAIKRDSQPKIAEKYGNLFDMYAADHGREPVQAADAHLPRRALHDGRPVGRLRPDVDDPGLFVLGEANFSDHGANRLGASALMQGLADGYFVHPYTHRRLPRGHASGDRQGRHRPPGVQARSRPTSRAASTSC